MDPFCTDFLFFFKSNYSNTCLIKSVQYYFYHSCKYLYIPELSTYH